MRCMPLAPASGFSVTEGFKHRLGTGRFEYFYTNRLELCISEVADIAE